MGPAGRAVATLPPTVEVFQILKEATNASQHGRMSAVAGHSSTLGNPPARACRAVPGRSTP